MKGVKLAGVHHVGHMTHLSAQMEDLIRKVDVMQVKPMSCEFCDGNHPNHEFQDANEVTSLSSATQANYVNN